MLINLFSNFPHKRDAGHFRRAKACYFALKYRFIDLKSLIELAACGAGTSDRRY
jgi:hypothetical protein